MEYIYNLINSSAMAAEWKTKNDFSMATYKHCHCYFEYVSNTGV